MRSPEGADVRRREFLGVLGGGAAAAWPLAARAQQSESMRRIAVLTGIAGNDAETKLRIAAFLQELHRLGWVEGRTVHVDIRGGAGSSAAVRGEWHDKQTVAGVVDQNSGGNVIYVGPGLRATYDRFSAYTLVGVPVVNHMNGLQSKSDYKVLTGMSFAF